MRIAVTGGSGFIGSNLVDGLLEAGHTVMVLDNLSTGTRAFLNRALQHDDCELVEVDLLTDTSWPARLQGLDAVFHLAANADVRFGWQHPDRDLQQNLLVTHRLLEACRRGEVGHFLFASTGSVYGETRTIPTPETCPFPLQTSLYGASKVAAEAFAQAYAEGTDLRVTIFRFVSILGPRYTHGHVIDFVRKLRLDPSHLDILGDGQQRKSYLDVTDCVAAVMSRLNHHDSAEVFNLGTDEYCQVADSARWISERLGLQPSFHYQGGDRGWVGDNPFIFLDTSKIRATGWTPRWTIRQAVERTVDYLVANEWLLELAR